MCLNWKYHCYHSNPLSCMYVCIGRNTGNPCYLLNCKKNQTNYEMHSERIVMVSANSNITVILQISCFFFSFDKVCYRVNILNLLNTEKGKENVKQQSFWIHSTPCLWLEVLHKDCVTNCKHTAGHWARLSYLRPESTCATSLCFFFFADFH